MIGDIMKADLTRYDFNALRFTKSEHVSKMSAEEVGSYVLLLNESWLLGKDASLPNDLKYLARIARVEKITDLVLDRFPVVETQWGQRRRNETLYKCWKESTVRSENAKKAIESRWNTDQNTTVSKKIIPKPTQSVPNIPNQNKKYEETLDPHSFEKPKDKSEPSPEFIEANKDRPF